MTVGNQPRLRETWFIDTYHLPGRIQTRDRALHFYLQRPLDLAIENDGPPSICIDCGVENTSRLELLDAMFAVPRLRTAVLRLEVVLPERD